MIVKIDNKLSLSVICKKLDQLKIKYTRVKKGIELAETDYNQVKVKNYIHGVLMVDNKKV
jgi:hypothetical protein